MIGNESQPLFAEERRELILRLLESNAKILVPDLCDRFRVSPATIRNDLRDLETEGHLKRTHGGAIALRKIGFEPTTTIKAVEHIDEKRRIAMRAAEYVEDGDTIALDTGTTIMELAKCLTEKSNLTIVTDDLEIALYLEGNSTANVVMVGGMIRQGFHCAVGPMAVEGLSKFFVDKAFMASNAFSLETGFTTPDISQSETKKTMAAIASQVYMLMDSSKNGRVSFVKFADIASIDKLITDDGLDKGVIQQIKGKYDNLDLIVVP